MLRSALHQVTLVVAPLLPLAGAAGLLSCDDPAESRAVTWGNPTEFPSLISPDPNELMAVAISAPERSTITHIGVIYKSGGFNAKAAIYADAGGTPGQLVAATGVMAVVAGRQEFPLTPTPLAPGTYWVTTLHSDDAGVGAGTGTTTVSLWANSAFTSPFPATFPSPLPSNGPPVNYYLQGTAP